MPEIVLVWLLLASAAAEKAVQGHYTELPYPPYTEQQRRQERTRLLAATVCTRAVCINNPVNSSAETNGISPGSFVDLTIINRTLFQGAQRFKQFSK